MPLDLIRAGGAIRTIESGSWGGNYGALGPTTRTGDRAYGAYQVMGNNIPSWTSKYFGQSLTPSQFLNNRAAQDAVFQGEFGRLAGKYGGSGAAQAWFAGEGGMKNFNATDVTGTSVGKYGSMFDKYYGPGSSEAANFGSSSNATGSQGVNDPNNPYGFSNQNMGVAEGSDASQIRGEEGTWGDFSQDRQNKSPLDKLLKGLKPSKDVPTAIDQQTKKQTETAKETTKETLKQQAAINQSWTDIFKDYFTRIAFIIVGLIALAAALYSFKPAQRVIQQTI